MSNLSASLIRPRPSYPHTETGHKPAGSIPELPNRLHSGSDRASTLSRIWGRICEYAEALCWRIGLEAAGKDECTVRIKVNHLIHLDPTGGRDVSDWRHDSSVSWIQGLHLSAAQAQRAFAVMTAAGRRGRSIARALDRCAPVSVPRGIDWGGVCARGGITIGEGIRDSTGRTLGIGQWPRRTEGGGRRVIRVEVEVEASGHVRDKLVPQKFEPDPKPAHGSEDSWHRKRTLRNYFSIHGNEPRNNITWHVRGSVGWLQDKDGICGEASTAN
ncbi:hypothetical protein B0H16DRAFT_1482115 [Mycena metata]|uniref:Uncharacterized protein n=1 Tax=Mycena metata TaxID=1033252 RepID=A0AAD7GUZ9_9AGAR|nr:hypothetical protein B0H16DRAFT_1482115 [Mycena metata]